MKISEEQLERARNTDLVDMLSHYGYSFKKTGSYYQCREHDSLVVYPDRRGFVWNSREISGATAIDWLMKVENMNFPSAVAELTGNQNLHIAQQAGGSAAAAADKPKALVLPKRAENKYSRVCAYLIKTRCIAAEVVQAFMRSHQLYQDENGNCVFVGFDESKDPKFACVRGTLSDKQYRGDCKGSDKRYAFAMDGSNKQKLYIFESPIDLMSHCTMVNQHFKSSDAFMAHSRLSLSGTSDVALEHYLMTHPDVRELNFRLDNDAAGHKATEELMAKYEKKGYIVHCMFAKEKDLNADLVKTVRLRELVKKTAQTAKSPPAAQSGRR